MKDIALRLKNRCNEVSFWRDFYMEQSVVLERSRNAWRAEVWFWRNLAEALS